MNAHMLGSTLAADPPTRSDIRTATDDVFSSSDFARNKSLLQRFIEWLSKHLNPPTAAGGAASGLSSIVSIVGLVLFVAMVAALVYFIVSRWIPRVKATDSDGTDIELTEVRSTAQWRSTAESHESAGEWKQAIRARFREIVGELVDRGVLDPSPGRTTGEFRIDVAHICPAALHLFDRASELFELPWYADEPTGPSENAEIRSLTPQIIEIVGRPTRPAVDMAGAS